MRVCLILFHNQENQKKAVIQDYITIKLLRIKKST